MFLWQTRLILENVLKYYYFSSNNSECFDTAIFYSQAEAVNSLKKYLELHFIETSPLIENYPQEACYEYVTMMSNRMGNYFSLGSDFCTCTYPYSLWVKFINRTIDDKNVVNKHLSRISNVLNSFYEQVEYYNFHIIMDKKLIEQVSKTGKYPPYDMYREYNIEDIIEHFENIVLLLNKYKNFKIALVNDNENTMVNKI